MCWFNLPPYLINLLTYIHREGLWREVHNRIACSYPSSRWTFLATHRLKAKLLFAIICGFLCSQCLINTNLLQSSKNRYLSPTKEGNKQHGKLKLPGLVHNFIPTFPLRNGTKSRRDGSNAFYSYHLVLCTVALLCCWGLSSTTFLFLSRFSLVKRAVPHGLKIWYWADAAPWRVQSPRNMCCKDHCSSNPLSHAMLKLTWLSNWHQAQAQALGKRSMGPPDRIRKARGAESTVRRWLTALLYLAWLGCHQMVGKRMNELEWMVLASPRQRACQLTW